MPTTARRVAFTILLRIETQASYATELLHGPLTADLSAPDAALATELVLGTLRRQATLDFIAQQFMQKKWSSLDAEVRVALRMGLYQLRFLTRIPARAAVHETVELVKGAGKRSAAGFVNAVLRKGAEVELTSLRPPAISDSEWLAIETSHPAWLLARWERRAPSARALAAPGGVLLSGIGIRNGAAAHRDRECLARADRRRLGDRRRLRGVARARDCSRQDARNQRLQTQRRAAGRHAASGAADGRAMVAGAPRGRRDQSEPSPSEWGSPRP
jgi:transcription termination factor NusB